MEDIKKIIAKNIASLRNGAHMTQAEFAEQLNYTDKAVSKWERGESIPDVTVLKNMADRFGVTVDWILCDHTEEKGFCVPDCKKKNHKRITLLAVLCVWLVAIIAFSILQFCVKENKGAWLSFVAAAPASCIILVVFNSIWGKAVNNKYWISLLCWSFIAFLYLLLLVCANVNFYMLFIIGVPLQIAVVIWHRMLK